MTGETVRGLSPENELRGCVFPFPTIPFGTAEVLEAPAPPFPLVAARCAPNREFATVLRLAPGCDDPLFVILVDPLEGRGTERLMNGNDDPDVCPERGRGSAPAAFGVRAVGEIFGETGERIVEGAERSGPRSEDGGFMDFPAVCGGTGENEGGDICCCDDGFVKGLEVIDGLGVEVSGCGCDCGFGGCEFKERRGPGRGRFSIAGFRTRGRLAD